MHIYVANSIRFELDCEVALYFADSALEILSVFNRDSSTNTAREFLGGLEFIIEQGYSLAEDILDQSGRAHSLGVAKSI